MRHLFLALGLCALTLAPPAQAGELTIRIPVTEAELASQSSLDALYDRIETAAENVCAASIVSPIEVRNARRRCVADVIANSVERAQIAVLSAHHAALQIAPVTETATLASR